MTETNRLTLLPAQPLTGCSFHSHPSSLLRCCALSC